MAPKKQKIRKMQITPNEVELQDGNGSSEATKQLEMEVKESQVPEQDQTEEPVQSNSAQDTVTTTESKKRKSGGPRSVCAMYKVVVKKARGKKFKVTYNERGIPNGLNRHTLQSYIGMLARTIVPIDKTSWPKVDPELKEKIWIDILVVYFFFKL